MHAKTILQQSQISASDLQKDVFGQLAGAACASLPIAARGAGEKLISALPAWTHPHKIADFGLEFRRIAHRLMTGFAAPVIDLICVDMICTLAQSLAARLIVYDIPLRVQANYPAAVQRLLRHIQQDERPSYNFSSDFFIKDMRFAALLTLPCHAEVLDLRSRLGPHIAGKFFLRQPGFRTAFGLIKSHAWLAYHTEARYLDEFTPEGWKLCYLDAAALLQRYADIQGLFAVTWFVDPALASISPHLAYLREVPEQYGAQIIPIRSTAADIAYATATSETRRRLYAEGRYIPKSHAMVWPRKGLLQWATDHA